MRIIEVDSVAELDGFCERWRYVYTHDANATVFQSWGWLRAWLGATRESWVVLAFVPETESQAVGFLALYTRTKDVTAGLLCAEAEVRLAGDPLTDYSAMLCLPEFDDVVVTAMRDYISERLQPSSFTLREVADPRLVKVVAGLDRRRYGVRTNTATPCPRILLPESWDKYLAEVPVAGFSKTLRRKLNKASRAGCIILDGEHQTVNGHIETFLTMSEARWGALGPGARSQFAECLRSCYEEGLVETKALVLDHHIVATQVNFVDNRNQIYQFYNGGRDPEFDSLSPGAVLHGHCIKQAIERGFGVYDFMRGAESYKYMYGAQDVFMQNYFVSSRALRHRLRRRTHRLLGFARRSLNAITAKIAT